MFARLLSCALVLCACTSSAGNARPLSLALAHPPALPEAPAAGTYMSGAGAGGLQGGAPAERLAGELREILAERGGAVEADGALGSAATLLLRDAFERRELTSARADTAARHYGFTGIVPSAGLMVLGDSSRDVLAQFVQTVPGNVPINRFGIAADEGMGAAVVVLGNQDVTHAPFPRSVDVGGAFRLSGEVAARFARASIFLTDPRGTVKELPMRARRIDAELRFPDAGAYELEIMGYGKGGPAVLLNVPVYAGMAEAAVSEALEPPESNAADVERRLFELTNEARRRAGVNPVTFDAELRGVALGHSNDMLENDFFGHVSPTTGGPDERARRAGLELPIVAENVGSGASAALIHEGLLASPAHRATMLHPELTNLGIAVVEKPQPTGRPFFLVTQLFARRPPSSAAHLTLELVLDTIQRLRSERRLSPVRLDPELGASAQIGLRALVPDDPDTRLRAVNAAVAQVQAEVNRTHRMRPPTCAAYVEIQEARQLALFGLALDPRLVNIGIGLRVIEQPGKARLALLFLGDAGRGSQLECK